jgi:NADH-quinone oxidoreductase subunit L
MLRLLWLVPALPLVGFVILAVTAGQLRRKPVSAIAVGSVSLSAFIAILITIVYIVAAPAGTAYSQTLWPWIHVGNFARGGTAPRCALRDDDGRGAFVGP